VACGSRLVKAGHGKGPLAKAGPLVTTRQGVSKHGKGPLAKGPLGKGPLLKACQGVAWRVMAWHVMLLLLLSHSAREEIWMVSAVSITGASAAPIPPPPPCICCIIRARSIADRTLSGAR
jgi:hypothetical protein